METSAIPTGAASAQVQTIVARWRDHLDYFWTPSPAQLAALAEGYETDPAFRENFDAMDERLASFMREAVAIYVASLKK